MRKITKKIEFIDYYISVCKILLLPFLIVIISCATNSSPGESVEVDICENYSDWQESEYILPYEPGSAYAVIQGNCAPKSITWAHYDNNRYAYDFGMPIGTPILAVRAGRVIFVRENFTDDQHEQEQGNALVVQHEDNTIALYGHMTQNGVLVGLGDHVEQGDVIALSGNSGMSPVPHLHLQVNDCADFNVCESVPVTFRNARPNNGRLLKDETYEAVAE